MSALENYLKQLNSAETQWGIWVNPENPLEEYRIGQYCFDHGGVLDDWVCIGNLESLSFGFQSTWDAFDEAASQAMGKHEYNAEALREAFFNEELADELQEEIQSIIDDHHKMWTEEEVWFFLREKLPAILEQAKADACA